MGFDAFSKQEVLQITPHLLSVSLMEKGLAAGMIIYHSTTTILLQAASHLQIFTPSVLEPCVTSAQTPV